MARRKSGISFSSPERGFGFGELNFKLVMSVGILRIATTHKATCPKNNINQQLPLIFLRKRQISHGSLLKSPNF